MNLFNWDKMSVNGSSSRISFCLFMRILVLIVILQDVSSGTVTGFQRFDISYFINTNKNENTANKNYPREPNGTNIITIDDYDPDYPYERLLQLIKDTKMILNSSDVTEKVNLLNLDPSVYKYYLNGDFSDFDSVDYQQSAELPSAGNFPPVAPASSSAPSSGAGVYPGSSGSVNLCQKEIQYRLPKRLTSIDGREHFILNVGDEFRQKIDIVNCRNPGVYCANPSMWPENRAFICEQSYDKIKKLISIPVSEKITLKQQNVNYFRVPHDCNCNMVRV